MTKKANKYIKGTHARCQKKDVLSGADLIHRYTFTLFYIFFGRRARELRPRRDFWTLTPYPLREVSSGRAPAPPSNHHYQYQFIIIIIMIIIIIGIIIILIKCLQ